MDIKTANRGVKMINKVGELLAKNRHINILLFYNDSTYFPLYRLKEVESHITD